MARRASAAVSEAEQVEEPTELLARAAAVDVAKNSGVVCTRMPHESRAGRKVQKVWTVPARYDDVVALADHLRCAGIEWSAPGWVEALIPGRVRGYGTPEEVLS